MNKTESASNWDRQSPHIDESEGNKKRRKENRHRKRDSSADRNFRRNSRERKRPRNYDNNEDRGENRNRSRDKSNFRSRFNKDFVPEQEETHEWGKTQVKEEPKIKVEKEKPNFGLSGKLTEDTNTVNGVVVKYAEPTDARKPKRRWRLYPFKGEKSLPVLYIHRQSGYLMGRDRKVADIPLDHPSVSKQHAALQYRLVPFTREDGVQVKRIRPYLIDLESANGTFINSDRIEPRRYYELCERDVIKFGFSSREYVLLHEHSKDDDLDDNIVGDISQET